MSDDKNYEPLYRLRHSASHVLAQAVLDLYPGTKLAIGPVIDEGFYYDFDSKTAFQDEDLPKIEKRFQARIMKKWEDVVQITIKSHQDIEHTPGVVAYLYSLFGDKGINIIETLSCYTDTVMIVEKNDAQKAVELLTF